MDIDVQRVVHPSTIPPDRISLKGKREPVQKTDLEQQGNGSARDNPLRRHGKRGSKEVIQRVCGAEGKKDQPEKEQVEKNVASVVDQRVPTMEGDKKEPREKGHEPCVIAN